jgi:hypothetical protein
VVTTIVHNPTANDRVEYFGQIVDACTTVEFPSSHCLTDGFRGSIAHAWTEVDEGLTPSGHRQSRPKGIAEKVELLVQVLPPSHVILAVHDLCLVWMQRKSTFSKPPVKICLQPLSLMLTAAVTNGIIGKAFKRNIRMVFGHPLIERIMQKEVRQ